METITIGQSEIESSRIGLGTWAIGGMSWGGSDESEAIVTIRTAIDSGITLIDTAPAYGLGRSEEIIGTALKEGKIRDQAIIATKAGIRRTATTAERDSSPERIREEVEGSLRRLKTDVIDLYQIHWPDTDTPFEATAEMLATLRQEGKIRAIGVSNFSPEQMDRFRSAGPLDSIQPPYNLFEREIEADILPYAKTTGLTLLSYGSLCRGLLSGTMRKDRVFEGDDLRNRDPKFLPDNFGSYLAAAEALKTLARDRFDKSLSALAVRWVLDKGPTIALWGARRPDQLDPVGDVAGWTIDAQSMLDIDAILEEHVPEPIAPTFMAPPAKPVR